MHCAGCEQTTAYWKVTHANGQIEYIPDKEATKQSRAARWSARAVARIATSLC